MNSYGTSHFSQGACRVGCFTLLELKTRNLSEFSSFPSLYVLLHTCIILLSAYNVKELCAKLFLRGSLSVTTRKDSTVAGITRINLSG